MARMLQLLCVGLLHGPSRSLFSLCSISFSCHPVTILSSLRAPSISSVCSSSAERCDWLVCPVCSFMPLFLPAAPHFLALLCLVIYLYVTEIILLQLGLREQSGCSRRQGSSLNANKSSLEAEAETAGFMPMSPGWGLKPQQGGLSFSSKQRDTVHSCSLFRVVALQTVGDHV